jgi:hypothetical protein
MSTRLVAHRPHAAFRRDHLARVGQVGGGRNLSRYARGVRTVEQTVCQSERTIHLFLWHEHDLCR